MRVIIFIDCYGLFVLCWTQFARFGIIWCHFDALSDPDVSRGFRIPFFIVFGSLWGALGPPFGEPFRFLWPPRGPKNRKKRRI
jgi:hypothetical protein